MLEKNNVYIGYSNNSETRYRATSGGLGSEIVRYLLDNKLANSSISFSYNYESLKYEPSIIFKREDYQQSGSIYHEVDLIRFIRNNVSRIESPFVCFALPCQVIPLRQILTKNSIEPIILELVCSSQQTFEATEFLFKRLEVKKEDVLSVKYRGEGWPGGIHIKMNNGSSTYVSNTNSVWSDIFHSKLFCMPRCFNCGMFKVNTHADIKLGDPWRIVDKNKENQGKTLCCVCTPFLQNILLKMQKENIITLEKCEDGAFLYSQEGVLKKKAFFLKHKKINNLLKRMSHNRFYRMMILDKNVFFRLHMTIIRVLNKIILR